MGPMTMTGLDKWYGYMKSHDRAALWDLLHSDAVFESPVVHTPQRGRDITFKYLSGAEKVLGGPGFKYLGEWRNANGAVLEFQTEIDGIKLNGGRHHHVWRRRPHHPFQGDGASAQGDQPAASTDGGSTGGSVRRGGVANVATSGLIDAPYHLRNRVRFFLEL
jgi:hypothetical protein